MLHPKAYEFLIDHALEEDGAFQDITSSACIPDDRLGVAILTAKQRLVLCGLDVAMEVFTKLDPACEFLLKRADGEVVSPGENILEIAGKVPLLLAAERTALNFMQRMSGVATMTAKYVDAVTEDKAKIVDTRKTIPGWRALDKYAVRTGGGFNHRYGLADGVLIKDNHIAAAGSIENAIAMARARAPHLSRIEIETATLHQVRDALDAGADVIMLDNMTLEDMKTAVELIDRKALTEASGGMTLERLHKVAQTGVDIISVGALTHSTPAVDIHMTFREIEPGETRSS